jgi:hypothetical protein
MDMKMTQKLLFICVALFIGFASTGCVNKHNQQMAQYAAEADAAAEKRKRDIETIREQGVPIAITEIYKSRPNSVGGIDVDFEFYNSSYRTFKYLEFTITPYNQVGDIASSETNGRSTVTVKGVGPMKPSVEFGIYDYHFFSFENIWYNHTINCVKLSEVKITYMDSTEESITGELLSAISPPNEGGCTL